MLSNRAFNAPDPREADPSFQSSIIKGYGLWIYYIHDKYSPKRSLTTIFVRSMECGTA